MYYFDHFTLQVLITLHFLAVGSYENSIGLNTWLSVSQSSVNLAINEVCRAIKQHLGGTWIKFPQTDKARTACILHNIALAAGLDLEEENVELPEVVINQDGHGKFYFFMPRLLLTVLFYSTSHR